MRIKPTWGIALVAMIVAGITQTAQAAPKPNILYLYADDLGWGSLNANSETETLTITPTIDSLVAGGINFRRAYGCMVCSPARSSQQTGFHQGHTWTDRNDKSDKKSIRAEDIAIGDMLQKAGYRVSYYGKWGYGADYTKIDPDINNPQTLPVNHGYNDILAELHHKRAHTFFQESLWFNNTDDSMETYLVYNANKGGKKKAYADDLYAEAAEKFIRTHANGPKPFFCEIAFQVPHTPLGEIENMPDWFDDYDDVDTDDWNDASKQYAAMVTRQDHHIAALLAALDDPNGDGSTKDSVRANTLVIFASDNGGQGGKPLKFFNTNGNLYGAKGSIKEGGIRVPTAFNWQGVIAPGQSTDRITCISDVLPTLCELAGLVPPIGTDGVSIAPFLTGKGVQRNRPWFTHEAGKSWSLIRSDGIKLRSDKGKLHLFNLADGENKNYEATDLLTLTDDPNYSTYEKWRDELHAIALAERVEEPYGFAHTHHHWTGKNGGRMSQAGNWSDTQSPNPLIDTGAPRESWNATLANTTKTDQTAILDSNLQTLGIEIAGNVATGAKQIVTIGAGKTLAGRNEIRISPLGIVKLEGGTLTSTRWVDLFENAILGGAGTIDATLYNSGTLIVPAGKGIAIQGDYHQTAKATLKATLGTHPPLTIQRAATLDGTLDIAFKNLKEKRFTVLSADSITGTFNNPGGIVESGEQRFRIHYTATTVELEKISTVH